jgi:hypothetical protein
MPWLSGYLMKPAVKRIVIKGTVLTLALHGFVLYTQYEEHGSISPAVWSRIALTCSLSLLLIAGMGFLLSRFTKDSGKSGPAGKTKSR